MSGKLLKEIHKAKPFDSLQQEAFLNVIRTADHLTRAFEELLKPHNLSPTQYNVLRILRGLGTAQSAGVAGGTGGGGGSGGGVNSTVAAAGADNLPAGIPCKLIGEHMLTRDPDITRLLDRLETRALITRQRNTQDRRVVSTRITAEGLRILKELDKPVADYHCVQFPNMPEAKLAQLIDLLEQARG